MIINRGDIVLYASHRSDITMVGVVLEIIDDEVTVYWAGPPVIWQYPLLSFTRRDESPSWIEKL